MLLKATKEVLRGLSEHRGIETKIRARGKFELLVHLELINVICKLDTTAKCWSEVEIYEEKRGSKRSPTLDLVIKSSKDGHDTYMSVEVKIIVTNYRHGKNTFIKKKNRNVTNAIDSFINDVRKHLNHKDGETLMLKLDGTKCKIDESYSLALVYPMPKDNRGAKAWEKHLKKIEGDPMSDFIVQDLEELQFGSETVPVGIYILKSTA